MATRSSGSSGQSWLRQRNEPAIRLETADREITMIKGIVSSNRRLWLCSALAALTLFSTHRAIAGQTFLAGKISNVTFAGDSVFIQLDSGLPGNCAGTSSGWMM